MILAVIRYVPCAIIDLVADLLAFPLALIAALPVFVITDENGRQHLRPIWRWIYTHDAPVDEYVMGLYFHQNRILSRYSLQKIRDSALLSYIGRVAWIWRNPAYRVSHWLGFDQRGVTPSPDRFRDDRWDTGEPNKAFWRVQNRRGQTGFLYQRQINWWRYTLEMQFGWKLYRRDADEVCMLAFRFWPFKKYR